MYNRRLAIQPRTPNPLKHHVEELLNQALSSLKRRGVLGDCGEIEVQVERARNPEHGDYASNAAMRYAKSAGENPMGLAEKIVERLPDSRHVESVDIAKPGFINFRLQRRCRLAVVTDILADGTSYGHQPDRGQKIILEFVSANPTGPLHVGHGRGAAYGASLAAVLDAAGYQVHREYYVNDHGRQMDILTASVWLRYLELCGEKVEFPDNAYQGEYVYDIARKVREAHGDSFRHPAFEVTRELPGPDEEPDSEARIDALVARVRELLGEEAYATCFQTALETMVADIREDLAEFGVHFDRWFSERELEQGDGVQQAIEILQKAGYLYQDEGAIWFRASALGDDKDRVVVREDGRTTYFASDLAYMRNKFQRGFDRAIYVFGADHHGYVPRLKAAARGLRLDPERLEIPLVQFAVLLRGGEKVQMSTRKGSFVTLRSLREEVGRDAARFFYVLRSHEQHLEFDLDLAKAQTQENPVYYIQYAHARVASVFRNLEAEGQRHNEALGEACLDQLTSPHEETLLRELGRYAELLESAARQRAPHLLAHYLQDLAAAFHAWYNSDKLLADEDQLRNARLNLARATQMVIAGALDLLGVDAPERM